MMAKQTLINVTAFSTKPYDATFLKAAIPEQIHLTCFDLPLNPTTAVMAHDALVVSAFVNDNIDEATLAILAKGKTKLIALRCAGFNQVDLVAAKQYGIKVVNVPAYSPYAVAEHTIALMLALSRKLPRAYNRVRDGNFSLDGLLGFDFYQKSVGIIGGGKIGQLVAERMLAFGCDVMIYDPSPSQACLDLGVKIVTLDTLLTLSDIISLHCPLNTHTTHLINASNIKHMKQGVMLINTSRGGLMDTHAILNGLKQHHIGYLGLDVYEQEGSLFFDDHSLEIIQDDTIKLLISLPNVIVTGHQAYFTKEAIKHISETTVQNILAFANNEKLINEVHA
jgi:D-lactate dehydrogenase